MHAIVLFSPATSEFYDCDLPVSFLNFTMFCGSFISYMLCYGLSRQWILYTARYGIVKA